MSRPVLSRPIAMALFPLLLAACSSGSDDPRAVTPDEAAQLNDAAAMLDANSIDLNAVDADARDDAANQTDAS